MEDGGRQGLKKLTQCYADQTAQYKDLEILALEQARALVAPRLDMKRIQEILERRLDLLENMEPLIEETRETQNALCAEIQSDQPTMSKLESLYGESPEFINFKQSLEAHKILLENMIHLDEANQLVMKERMDEMKTAERSLRLKSHARKAYRKNR